MLNWSKKGVKIVVVTAALGQVHGVVANVERQDTMRESVRKMKRCLMYIVLVDSD